MKDKGESLQGVRSGQAPGKREGRVKSQSLWLLQEGQKSGGSGNGGKP